MYMYLKKLAIQLLIHPLILVTHLQEGHLEVRAVTSDTVSDDDSESSWGCTVEGVFTDNARSTSNRTASTCMLFCLKSDITMFVQLDNGTRRI